MKNLGCGSRAYRVLGRRVKSSSRVESIGIGFMGESNICLRNGLLKVLANIFMYIYICITLNPKKT